ncbi:annexin A3-like [Protopterus annectens]|uniref:annexin A3-like n=1 Tax=Protopterus annectens TaxID=7888 RepID=UPI001CFBDE38|nr:annexin A3-like [Protopterus annectens]
MASSSVWVGNRGTVKDFHGINAGKDADDIRKAIKGIGTDEQTLINIIPQRSNAQRQLICKEYKTAYKSVSPQETLLVSFACIQCFKKCSEMKGQTSRPLMTRINEHRSNIKNKWETNALYHHVLQHQQAQFMFMVIDRIVGDRSNPQGWHSILNHKPWTHRKVNKGSGTDEPTLIEILASRNNCQKKEILLAYQTAFGRILGDDISSDTSGDFKKCLLLLKEGTRDENPNVDENLAKSDAQALYQAGEGKWGTDEHKFIHILCMKSISQLRRTFEEYRKMCNKDIEESIKGEMSGTLEHVLLAVVKCVKNTPAFFAERLWKSMKGAGTDEATLTRIMVSRSEIDLQDIKAEYKKLYGTSLNQSINSDTSGDYRTTLLKICGGD